jgi:Berberine and berberine like
MFMDTVDEQVARTIMRYLQASDAAVRAAQLRVLGGAMARVPADAAAFAHRGSRIMANVAAFYEGPADRPVRQAWVEEFAAALRQGDGGGAYVGFLADEDQERVHQAYPGSTWERLAAVKRRYDPGNLFRRNHNVPPAPETAERRGLPGRPRRGDRGPLTAAGSGHAHAHLGAAQRRGWDQAAHPARLGPGPGPADAAHQPSARRGGHDLSGMQLPSSTSA